MGKKTPAKKQNKDQPQGKRGSITENEQPNQVAARSEKPAKEGAEAEKVSLFKNPVRTLQLFSRVIVKFIQSIVALLVKYYLPLSVLGVIILLAHIIEGPHSATVQKIDDFAEFALYWIILGVASSIGLGTGLHTFVLYLGPHIAKVTMVANECNAIPEYLPSRWTIRPTFGDCPPGEREQISFFTILMAVQIEAFLWGFGTALGELPPYFVARAASLAGNTSEELEELEKEGASSLLDKAKLLIYKGLKRFGFVTVLLCASIPNPLFDLAGLTCGHFGIPFATFFSATALGKAVIKVHLQMLFVIFMFTNHHVENLLGLVERNIPALSNSLSNMLEKQKRLLHSPPNSIKDEKPLIAQLWDYFIFLMICFFVVSIIESLANNELEIENNEKKNAKGDKKKANKQPVEDQKKAVKEEPKKVESVPEVQEKAKPVEAPVEKQNNKKNEKGDNKKNNNNEQQEKQNKQKKGAKVDNKKKIQ